MQLKFVFFKTSPCLCRRGRQRRGHRETAPNGATAPLSPKSEPVSPEGHPAAPRTESPPAGQAMVGGGGGLPRPIPRGKEPFGGAARTDGSLQDSRTRPHAESSTEPPAPGQTLGGQGGHGLTPQPGPQGLCPEHGQHPLPQGQGSLQSPSQPRDLHALPRLPPRSAPQPGIASLPQEKNPKSPQEC